MYRERGHYAAAINQISGLRGTAVNIQAMVFGNMVGCLLCLGGPGMS